MISRCFLPRNNHFRSLHNLSLQHILHTSTRTMATSTRTYGDAITALNSLQSNFAILSAIRASGKSMNAQAIPEMHEWLRRISLPASFLTPLNILHIAGTKGKGSTSAFAANILRQYSLTSSYPSKVGLYTSPHLRAVRERIQINGEPISEEMFAKYFFEVWDRMEQSAEKEGRDKNDKPVYFRFLTLVAFHTFLSEGVDATVVEVGVGGEYDSTNVIEKPTVTAITSLGIDHVGVLGETIGEIAWHKAGIFKPGATALSVRQPEAAEKVIEERAREKGVDFRFVEVHPDIVSGNLKLGLLGEFQKINASLAVTAVQAHMHAIGRDIGSAAEEQLPEQVKKGLESVVFPGRCQVIKEGSIEWNIDGAHTMESLNEAGAWFGKRAKMLRRNRVLIFNQQNRDAPEKLLGGLANALRRELGDEIFTHAFFCTNVTYKEGSYKPDLMSVGSNTDAVKALTVQKDLAKAWADVDPRSQTQVFGTIQEAVEAVRQLEGETQALVTGSLHLVGGLLEVLDPQ